MNLNEEFWNDWLAGIELLAKIEETPWNICYSEQADAETNDFNGTHFNGGLVSLCFNRIRFPDSKFFHVNYGACISINAPGTVAFNCMFSLKYMQFSFILT